jgi:hypothetical protein
MAKFAIARRTVRTSRPAATSDTGKAVANSTPLIHSLCSYIMDKANQESKVDSGYDSETAEINKLFATFANDNVTTRLASVVELLTGIKPKTAGPLYEVGEVVIDSNKNPNVIVYNNGIYSYGVNKTGNGYSIFTKSGGGYPTGTKATLAETGLFCKDFLKVNGLNFLNYLNASISTACAPALFKTIGFEAAI